jgi:hypothetical protein
VLTVGAAAAASAAFFKAVRVHDDENQSTQPSRRENGQHRIMPAGFLQKIKDRMQIHLRFYSCGEAATFRPEKAPTAQRKEFPARCSAFADVKLVSANFRKEATACQRG